MNEFKYNESKWSISIGLVYLFNGISTPYRLFNAEHRFIRKCLITIEREEEEDPKERGGCPRGVMVKAMDPGIVVSEFVLQSRYYVRFRANTLGKGMNPLILPAMG